MVIRTYFNRNNTIIKNEEANTGQNPVTELFYGSPNKEFSRYIFQFDVDRLEEFRNQGMFPDLSKFKHTLRMTNTGAFDKRLMGDTTFHNKNRSSSFDLALYPLSQSWDEGVGYDYIENTFVKGETENLSNLPSNWFESMTNIPWAVTGTTTGVTSGIIQHFEHGNENLEMDVTSIVNSYLSGDTNYGLGLAYTMGYESMETAESQYVGFFTRHTQTFYEPYVESIYDDRIVDNRINFYLDKDNRLYLYVNVGGKPTNLDNLPTVNVYNDDGELLSATTATSASQGVYYIDMNIPSDGQNDCTLYTDVWSNISINGKSRPDVEMEFSVKSEGYYDIGSDGGDSQDFMFSVEGINYNETIKRGDIRKVIVNAKIPYTSAQMMGLEDVEYRIYIKEGKAEYTVIDYQKMNLGNNQNYFLLDTLSLLPAAYYMDVKYSSNYEVKLLPEVLKFEIVSQVELRKSQ